MRTKKILLPDNSIILDFGEILLVIDHHFAEKHLRTEKHRIGMRKDSPFDEPLPCHAYEFTTKKGRKALRIMEGDSHTYYLYYGGGDVNWNDWHNRKPVNAMFAKATRESNGGGCWLECIIMERDVKPVSAEQAEYMEEL